MVKSLRHAGQLKDMIESTFKILIQLGEQLPRPMGETRLMNDIQAMNDTLLATTDADILNMREITDRKMFILLKLYAILVNALHLAKPSLVGAVALQMVALTMNFGLTAISPLAFAFYGELLVSLGMLGDGCRFGMCHCNMSSPSQSNHLFLSHSVHLPSRREACTEITREEKLTDL